MPTSLEVMFTPADFAAMSQRNLGRTTCVVLDILRATTSMITALANGAEAIIPVEEIAEALAIKQRQPAVLLAGERHGLRIRADQTGSLDFDLGNSPREFTAERVRGRTIVTTTTNGTRALRACAGTRETLVGSFLNLSVVADRLKATQSEEIILVCSGTFEQTAYEDVLAAGALAAELPGLEFADSAWMALRVWEAAGGRLEEAMRFSRNGRRLLAHSELAADVPFCLRRDTRPILAVLSKGAVRRV